MTRVTGRWQIVEMDLWDHDAIDLLGPAFIEIGADGTGSFRFIAVEGDIDGRNVERDGRPRWSSAGSERMTTTATSGRGWALLEPITRSSATSSCIAATTPASGQLPGGCPNKAEAPEPPTARKRREAFVTEAAHPGRGLVTSAVNDVPVHAAPVRCHLPRRLTGSGDRRVWNPPAGDRAAPSRSPGPRGCRTSAHVVRSPARRGRQVPSGSSGASPAGGKSGGSAHAEHKSRIGAGFRMATE